MSTSIESLCKGLPECFLEYIKYCRKLKFDEDPDYDYLKDLFYKYCLEDNITPEYEWSK